jgi:alkylation response protein AidB-like acyl-CoA dehydrogenase
MTDWNALPDDDFRAEVRAFYAANFPDHLRDVIGYYTWDMQRDWYRKLYEQGWAAPSWPPEYGGMGLDANKLLIFVEERLELARGPDFGGIVMLGPVLMKFATPEQKAYYLPRILSGKDLWAQGYSEPGAGSDLAGLRTEAVLDGDEFVVNGQKIWTTWGLECSHMFALVRTDKTVKKQEGISFLLLDLKSPGVKVRGIRNLAGGTDFCEVFFDDVRVPKENLIGELNKGWTVSKALVGHERLLIGNPQHCQRALERLALLASSRKLFDDVGFVDKYTELTLDVEDLSASYARYCDLARRGQPIGADVSLLKIVATETLQRINELIVESAADYGGSHGVLDFGDARIDVLHPFYISRPTTIGAGTSEVQRNVMAKFVLGLPA